jgi:putative transposase
VVDSRSVKSTGVGGERGYDGGKKVKGRKRHLLVDTQGLVLKAKVHAVNIHGSGRDQGTPAAGRGAVSAPFAAVAGRSGYRGENKGKDWVEKALGWSVELVERARKPAPKEVLMAWAEEWAKEGVRADWEKLLPPKGFQVLPKRWVVERTFSWTEQNRRMSKDYERLPESSEAFIYVAMSRLMARRLARS